MDLGLERDDVVGALDAYGDAVERPMDLGDVNGEVFVNNVSLGLVTPTMNHFEYRDAKVDTTVSALQEALAPGTPPFDLRFTDHDGVHHDGAHRVQVSNGRYGQTLDGMASRPRLDAHELQVIALEFSDCVADASRSPIWRRGTRSATPGTTCGRPPPSRWTRADRSRWGWDGEARTMGPPLRFSLRERQVRVRLPQTASIGYSPAGRSLCMAFGHQRCVPRVAAGHPVPIETGG